MLCKPQGLTCDAEGCGYRKVLTASYLAKCLRLTKVILHVSPESFSQVVKLSLASSEEMIEYAPESVAWKATSEAPQLEIKHIIGSEEDSRS